MHVPSTGRPPGYDGQHNIAWELNGDPRFDATSWTLRLLADEVAGVGAPNVCLSSEDFEYLHAKPAALQSILAAFKSIQYRSKIIIYLRPQFEYERSLYDELLKNGIAETAHEFHAIVMRHRMFRCRESWVFKFDYDRLLAPFAETFGKRNVIVRHYRSEEPDTHLLEEFLKLILPNASTVRLSELKLPLRMNASRSS